MNIVYALVAYPAGAAADRLSARTLLLFGLGVLMIADMALAMASLPWVVLVGAALWGLHMALTQGLLSKLVADTAPTELRGTAFGIFNLMSGGALLLASVIAGLLWSEMRLSHVYCRSIVCGARGNRITVLSSARQATAYRIDR